MDIFRNYRFSNWLDFNRIKFDIFDGDNELYEDNFMLDPNAFALVHVELSCLGSHELLKVASLYAPLICCCRQGCHQSR